MRSVVTKNPGMLQEYYRTRLHLANPKDKEALVHRLETMGKARSSSGLAATVQRKPDVQLSPVGQIIQRQTTEAECDAMYEACKSTCRRMPGRTRIDKARRKLCWAECMAAYATCLAQTREGMITIGAIVAAIILASADGPLPLGDAAALALLAYLGIDKKLRR